MSGLVRRSRFICGDLFGEGELVSGPVRRGGHIVGT